ncbi:hypothetical protein BC351_19405 [Paenibacillus ferrarius]|uniref:Uncharacterized protein n=1 Tax=Paenibacillus ferrarius TaxID=1469647 RepID=A0A1V4HP68_9BACL|nr:hypothetical protein BC351_19405 [Paenibacillus ferrarius]
MNVVKKREGLGSPDRRNLQKCRNFRANSAKIGRFLQLCRYFHLFQPLIQKKPQKHVQMQAFHD